MRQERSARLTALSHYIAAFVVFLKGLEKADHFGHNWPFVVVFWLFALLILLFTLFHSRIERSWRLAPSFVRVVEAAVFALVAVYTFKQGKHLLPYAYSVASLAYLVVGVIHCAVPRKPAH